MSLKFSSYGSKDVFFAGQSIAPSSNLLSRSLWLTDLSPQTVICSLSLMQVKIYRAAVKMSKNRERVIWNVYTCVCLSSLGVRLYFSTTPFVPPHQKHVAVRPSLLALVHVRLPPGFSASSTLQKPAKVHKALHSKGITFPRLLVIYSAHWPACNKLLSLFKCCRCSANGCFWDRGQRHSVVHQPRLLPLQETLDGDSGWNKRHRMI